MSHIISEEEGLIKLYATIKKHYKLETKLEDLPFYIIILGKTIGKRYLLKSEVTKEDKVRMRDYCSSMWTKKGRMSLFLKQDDRYVLNPKYVEPEELALIFDFPSKTFLPEEKKQEQKEIIKFDEIKEFKERLVVAEKKILMLESLIEDQNKYKLVLNSIIGPSNFVRQIMKKRKLDDMVDFVKENSEFIDSS